MCPADDITELFANLARSFQEETRRRRDSQTSNTGFPITRSNVSKCCEYLYCYAAYHCALVEYVILMLAFSGEWPIKGSLSVLSIGGGPGTDLAGLCSILSQLGHPCLQLSLGLMEPETLWQPSFERLMACLSQPGTRIGKLFHNRDVKPYFIAADVTKYPLPAEVSAADLILMTNVLPRVMSKERNLAVQNIFSLMKGDSLFIFIDFGMKGILKIAAEENMKIVYRSPVRDINRLSPLRRTDYEICVIRKQEFVFITQDSRAHTNAG